MRLPGERKSASEAGSLVGLAGRCAATLEDLYRLARATGADPSAAYLESVRLVVRLLAVLIAAERIGDDRMPAVALRSAADAIVAGDGAGFESAASDAHATVGLAIFVGSGVPLDVTAMSAAAASLLSPQPDAPIQRLFFETMPLSWLGSVYQHLRTFRPDDTGDALQGSRSYRKGRGMFYTPSCLVDYIVEGVLTPIVESRAGLFGEGVSTLAPQSVSLPGRGAQSPIRVLDPAMGGGDFLSRSIEFLAERVPAEDRGQARARIASECVFGVDVDPGAVEIARFCAWAGSGFADGVSEALNRHLVCANALGARHADEAEFDWTGAFPEVFAVGGFDAVVGNPPYIAAKNGLRSARATGQSDSYLLFVLQIIDNKLVRLGGLFSMVLPDPMLVRENAAAIRRRLVTDWTIVSLLHISESFPDALVANVVPICRNAPAVSPTFLASRIERAADRRSFIARPRQTALRLAETVRVESILAQDRCEFLYLLEQGAFGEIIRRIHGDDCALSSYIEPYAPLRKLNVKAIYRGEEVGKSAINRESGDQPMLLGGQSIQPYEIVWEGRTASVSWIKKPLERYHSTKILIQKSSAHVIAALDRVSKSHPGYVFPQSVYAVELADPGMDPLYLLCILNSRVINEYIRRTVTGYKLLQPQLELEDIRALPIRRVSFTTDLAQREIDAGQGIDVFESESIRGEFPALANFAVACLTRTPERSDVVHDVLVHLGRELVTLARVNRRSPDVDATRRMSAVRTAIETLVWCLYASDPAQMALPW